MLANRDLLIIQNDVLPRYGKSIHEQSRQGWDEGQHKLDIPPEVLAGRTHSVRRGMIQGVHDGTNLRNVSSFLTMAKCAT